MPLPTDTDTGHSMSPNANKTVALLAPHRFALDLMIRCDAALKRLGYRPLYVVPRYHMLRELRQKGMQAVFIQTQRTHIADTAARSVNPQRTIEYSSGLLNAPQLCSYVQQIVHSLQRHGPFDTLITFNGDNAMGEAIRAYATQQPCNTLFLEIGNFPGKLFADPWGCNASSRLYAHPQAVLNALPAPDMQAFHRWRAAYHASLQAQHSVPQASMMPATYVTRLRHQIWDAYGRWFKHGAPLRTPPHKRAKQRSGFACNTTLAHAISHDALPHRFAHLPLQVSDDTQLLIHAQMTNQQAIYKASDIAQEAGLPLVITPHPAERDASVCAEIAALCQEHGIVLSARPSMECAQHAALVITVNSTLGLQAQLLGKAVTYLGKSLFAALTDDEAVASYLQAYLLEIEPFATQPIATPLVAHMLARSQRFI